MVSGLLKDINLIIRSFNKIKVSKMYLLMISIILICINITSFTLPMLFGNIINGIVDKSLSIIVKNLFLMCSIYLISTLINYIYKIIIIKLKYNIESKMKVHMFEDILNLPYSRFIKFDKGTLINNIESDSTIFPQLIISNLSIIVSLLNIAISLVLMISISPTLTFFIILTIPVYTLIYIYRKKN